MTETLSFDGLTIAPNVLDTMVRLAAREVKGVAGLGVGVRKTAFARAVEIDVSEDAGLLISIHIQAFAGEQLRDLGKAVQAVVADALKSQLGIETARVDVYIDGLAFPE